LPDPAQQRTVDANKKNHPANPRLARPGTAGGLGEVPVRRIHALRLTLVCALALLALGAPTVSRAAGNTPAACVDDTPHKIRMVQVAPGVDLEVVDWGGTGEAMVLLTGLGDNAHVYDGFAFQFTDHFHVIGITRRGFLPSTQPQYGYDVPTRAADDIAVLDALGIAKAVFVGHSLAGSELSRLGQAYAGRVDKLVYLDAADLSERFLPSRAEPPSPVYTDADLKSLWAYQAAGARLQATREPAQAACLGVVFDAKGAITDSSTPDWVSQKLLAGVAGAMNPPVDWAAINAPRLGIFAPYTRKGRQPWYWYLSPEKQAEFDRAWPPIVSWFRKTVAKFAKGNSADTFTLPDASHYIYINNEAQVVRWMRDFLDISPDQSGARRNIAPAE
jgi:pimeloyl-ACP methyl ester carboxylesterase